MPTTQTNTPIRPSSRRHNYARHARAIAVTPSPSNPTRAKARRWTSTEEEVLYSSLRNKLAQPLKDTFAEVASATNRTPASVSSHWYAHLSYADINHPAYALLGKNMISINRKGFRNKRCVYHIPSGILSWVIERII